MFNTMTVTKIGGALCGALLVFLLLNWLANSIYSTGSEHGAQSEAAYVIDTGEAPAAADTAQAASTSDAAAPKAPTFADLFASADIKKGKKVFAKCKACHKIDKGVNAIGPALYGVVGRDIASAPNFKYSGALQGLSGNWAPEKLNIFLTSPKAYAPGTKMGFQGLKKTKDRANIIAFLKSIVK